MPPPPNPASPSLFQRWMLAIRPRTLPAAMAPVFVGIAVAQTICPVDTFPALVILGCAILLQILANLVNDVADFQKGTDTTGRLGPVRVTQSGLLTPRQVWTGAVITALLAAAGGVYLATLAGLPVILMGSAAILFAVFYTVGPFALEDHGLGDLFSLIFFGFVAVCGTTWILAGVIPILSWLGGLTIGCLITAILVVNNVRDIESDLRAGRRNIPTRFGRRAGELEYGIMLVVPFLVLPIAWALGWINAWILLPFLAIPRGFQLWRMMTTLPAGPGFNRLLALTAQFALIYAILYSAAVLLG